MYSRALPIQLRVKDAGKEDVGRSIVRLTGWARQRLRAELGDVVELRGRKHTAALVARAYPADLGAENARVDRNLRENLGVDIGEQIQVRRVIGVFAKSILFAGLDREWARGEDWPDLKALFTNRLMGRPVHRGAKALVYRNGDLEAGLFDPNAGLMVLSTEPPGIVRVGPRTKLRFSHSLVRETWVEQNGAIQFVLDDYIEMGDQ